MDNHIKRRQTRYLLSGDKVMIRYNKKYFGVKGIYFREPRCSRVTHYHINENCVCILSAEGNSLRVSIGTCLA